MASNPLLSSQFELHEQEGYAWSTPQARRCNVFKAFKDGIAPLVGGDGQVTGQIGA